MKKALAQPTSLKRRCTVIKRILILSIFLILIAIGIFDVICVNSSINGAMKKTEEIESLIEEDAELSIIKEKANKMQKDWVKNEKVLTIFMYYRDIDTLGKQISLVQMLINENKIDDAKVEIGGLKYLLVSAKKVSEFSIDNIF